MGVDLDEAEVLGVHHSRCAILVHQVTQDGTNHEAVVDNSTLDHMLSP